MQNDAKVQKGQWALEVLGNGGQDVRKMPRFFRGRPSVPGGVVGAWRGTALRKASDQASEKSEWGMHVASGKGFRSANAGLF